MNITRHARKRAKQRTDWDEAETLQRFEDAASHGRRLGDSDKVYDRGFEFVMRDGVGITVYKSDLKTAEMLARKGMKKQYNRLMRAEREETDPRNYTCSRDLEF